MKKITIAIDGLSSCGKSTMAKDLAKKVGYVYVDTGAMYRSVTLYALRHNLFNSDGSIKIEELRAEMPNIHISFIINEETGRPETYLNNENVEKEIRSLEVSNHVSRCYGRKRHWNSGFSRCRIKDLRNRFGCC